MKEICERILSYTDGTTGILNSCSMITMKWSQMLFIYMFGFYTGLFQKSQWYDKLIKKVPNQTLHLKCKCSATNHQLLIWNMSWTVLHVKWSYLWYWS